MAPLREMLLASRMAYLSSNMEDKAAATCSCVSIRTAKGIHVLEIDGQRTVPSIVAFTDKDYLVGKAAKSQVRKAPQNSGAICEPMKLGISNSSAHTEMHVRQPCGESSGTDLLSAKGLV